MITEEALVAWKQGRPTLQERIGDIIREKDQSWDRIIAPSLNVKDLETFKGLVFFGKDCQTFTADRLRIISPAAWPITSGQVARVFLNLTEREFDYDSRYKFPGARSNPDHDYPANYFVPCPNRRTPHRGEYMIVDIRSAYGQLMSRMPGPAVYYRPSQNLLGCYLNWQWADNEVLLRDKYMARSVFGSLHSSRMLAYNRGRPIELGNRYHAPDLTRWVLDIHHALAKQALTEYGCLRWRIDGGIFPIDKGNGFLRLLSSLGIQARIVAQGRGQLCSIDCWKVGERSTRKWYHGNRSDDYTCDTEGTYRVKYDDLNWLLHLLADNVYLKMRYNERSQ